MEERLIIDNIEIPLSGSLNPSFTRSITDIKEPEKRKSTYSKSIKVPNSKEANILFDSIWDINSVTNTFDPTKKADVIYIVDGWEVVRGYCQLKDITKNQNRDIEYTIVIYGELSSLFNEIKGKELTDLTGLDTYDHDLTLANQNKSSGNNGETYEIVEGGVYVPAELGKGYIYALIDFGYSTAYGKNWNVEAIGCSVYSKEYWDRIHEQAGFTYEFLDPAFEDHFKHLIVPASPSKFVLDSTEIADREFKSNTTEFTSTGTDTSNSFTGVTANDIIKFTNEISDPGGVYDPATGKFTCLDSGYYTFSGLVDVYATFTPPTGVSVESVSPFVFTLKLIRYEASTGLEVVLESSAFTIIKAGFSVGARSSDSSPTYPSGDYLIGGGLSATNPPNRLQCSAVDFELLAGDEVYLAWVGNYAGLFEDGGGIIYTGGTATVTTTAGSWFNKVANFQMLEGNTLKVEKAIPEKVKQTDFLMNYIKEYNLYVDNDPEKPNHLLYAPRDTFYRSNTIDLSGESDGVPKVSNKSVVYKPMGALDANRYIFKHKDDSDYLNTLYSDKWNETYGQREILSTNEFNNKDRKTEVSSSSTPIADNGDGNNRVIPKIIKIDETSSRILKKYNWRTLYYGGLKDNFENWLHKSDLVADVSQTKYPYAGHFDDPFNPTLDINFGLVREVFYDDTLEDITVTDNNLYNKYHSKFIREITDKDSKLVECEINMQASDFKQWSFRDLYYFDRAFFRLQEIQGFNPTSNNLTKCVFLKLKEVSPFKSQLVPADGGGTPFEPQVDDGGTGGGEVIAAEISPSKAITQSPKQNENTYNSESSNIIVGDNNKVSVKASEVVINGNDNKVYSGANNINLIGSNNNTIQPNLSNVTLINTNDVNITNSNVTYIGGNIVNTDVISLPTNVEHINSSQNVSTEVITYEVDTSSGDVTLSFNTGSIVYKEGQIWNFKKMSTQFNLIISSIGATIDGGSSVNIYSQYSSLSIQFDGVNFIII